LTSSSQSQVPTATLAVGTAMREQTRARYPDADGYVSRDGVRLYYEVYGSGQQTLCLLPTWAIVHSRFWKLQIPYLSRHCRVIAFDGRGGGRSDQPVGAEAYTIDETVADALAVLDATGTERATVVGFSCAALTATVLAADHPERVDGVVYIGPAVALAPGHRERNVYPFDDALDTEEGWAKYNRHYWCRDFRGFLAFFFGKAFNEAHSTKQIEDAIGWALTTRPETLVDTERGIDLPRHEDFREACARVRCPTLVLHGDRDLIRPHAQGRALADATRGRVVTLEGSGHCPQARDPVRVNLILREFVRATRPRARRPPRATA
jgi:pimeloyl-ACP methyl ester carboxylesterase